MQTPVSDDSLPSGYQGSSECQNDSQSTQVVEALIIAVRSLALDDNRKTIAGVFDEIPQLRGQIKSKDVELSRAKREVTDLESDHQGRIEQELELYCTR